MRNQQELEEKEALRQKELNKAKTRLFTNITHEFRTPLTVISGMADLIEKEHGRWIPEGTNRIRNNSSLMLRLVNQLLDISKIEAKAMPVHIVKADIAAYTGLIIELHRSAAIEKNIALSYMNNLGNDGIMDFDPDIISKIFSNLLGNAIKFTPQNGTVSVSVNLEESGMMFLLRVADNGRGIPPDKVGHIFDPFYQAEDHSASGGGTGLGLALAQELAMLVNGNISVESEPGKGLLLSAIQWEYGWCENHFLIPCKPQSRLSRASSHRSE